MGFRKFTSRDGHQWDVRPRTRAEWAFEPVGENPNRPRAVASPGYEADPFELSQEELQRLFDQSREERPRSVKSPFKD